ncbi:MAG: outer membrane protein assembly factor BamE [Magnetococcales bacterium]|nr:outer membrane protein assembly factor BamE [Magnetococcales bacterium]
MKYFIRSHSVIPCTLIVATLLTGCQAQMHESGIILAPDATAKIHPGVTTRSEVLELLGPPTLVNTFRSNRWLYVQDRKFKNMQRTFSRVSNRVEITFDTSGVVTDIKKNFDDQLWDPTKLPDAKNNKGWVSWIWDGSYIRPATNPNAPPEVQPVNPPEVAAPPPEPPAETAREPAPRKKSWWRFWSSDAGEATRQ